METFIAILFWMMIAVVAGGTGFVVTVLIGMLFNRNTVYAQPDSLRVVTRAAIIITGISFIASVLVSNFGHYEPQANRIIVYFYSIAIIAIIVASVWLQRWLWP